MRVDPTGVVALSSCNERHLHETLPPGPPTRKLTSHRCALWPGSYQAGLRQLLGQRYGQPDNCLPWASIADLTAMLRTAQTVQIRRSAPRGHNPWCQAGEQLAVETRRVAGRGGQFVKAGPVIINRKCVGEGKGVSVRLNTRE